MKDVISVNIGQDHIYHCATRIIGRAGESKTTRLEITIPDELADYWAYLDFRKQSGETIKTPRLDVVGNVIAYDVPLYVLSESGDIEVQLVLQKESGEIWKSSIKKYNNLKSINATDDIPNKEDFITNAQRILDQAGGFWVNAIDTVKTQTVSKSTSETVYQYAGEGYSIYDSNGLADVVKDNRGNYTINGEPATVITVPSVTIWNDYEGRDEEYSSYLGLESATWKYTYFVASSYALKGIYCKDSDFLNNNYETTITVTYDEEEATVTTSFDTPLVDILEAIKNGTDIICKWNNLILRLAEYDLGWSAVFTAMGKAYNGSYDYFYRITYDYAKVTAEKLRFYSYKV